MLTTTVVIDLRAASADRRNAGELQALPPGARAIVEIGNRSINPEICWWISDFLSTNHIELRGSATAVARWRNCILDGRPGMRVGA